MNAQLVLTQQNNAILPIIQSDMPIPMWSIRKSDGAITCSIGIEYPTNEADPNYKPMRVAIAQVTPGRRAAGGESAPASAAAPAGMQTHDPDLDVPYVERRRRPPIPLECTPWGGTARVRLLD